MCPPEAGAEAKVGEFDVSVTIYEDVVGLDVAVNEAHLVHTLYRTHKLPDVESVGGWMGRVLACVTPNLPMLSTSFLYLFLSFPFQTFT